MLRVAIAVAVLLAGCGSGDGGEGGHGGAGGGEPWSVVLTDQPAAFYSVWAPARDDVWVVGTDPGDGPSVLHFDGAVWKRKPTGTTGSLRWILGFPGGPIFVAGDGGTVLRTTDGSHFEALPTPGTRTVWGIWGATPDDLWAVGGETGSGFVWHLEDGAFVEATGLPEGATTGGAVFKVWGRAADDVWIVGAAGLVLHGNGTTFVRQGDGVPPDLDLRTVHGDASQVVAVGGFANAFAASTTGAGPWTADIPASSLLPALNGVFVSHDRWFAVGVDGLVVRHEAGTTEWEAQGLTRRGLHGVTIDPSGGVWAVGGRLELSSGGTILHRGGVVPGTVE